MQMIEDGPKHELAFARLLVPKQRSRWRYLAELPKRRKDLLEQLNNAWFDPAFIVPRETWECGFDSILATLRHLGAKPQCYCISMDSDYDRRVLELETAVKMVAFGGPTTFLSCLAGRLGYFEGELGMRHIVFRSDRSTRRGS